jgi:uncharacterized tellurite resistance protein B-like protein
MMQPSRRSGFQATGDGVQFWFRDRDNVASFVGVVTSLEDLGNGEFRLQTAKGPCLRVQLRPEQVAEYRRLGGLVRPMAESGPAARPQATQGFHKAPSGVFFWSRNKYGVKYLGPVTGLREEGDGHYALMVNATRYAITLSSEEVDEFERLSGTPAGEGNQPSSGSVTPHVTASPTGPLAEASTLPESPHQESVPHGERMAMGILNRIVAAGKALLAGRREPGRRLVWRGTAQKIEIGPYLINDPLTYSSRGAPSEEEASCINVKLPIGKPVVERQGALGYQPQYAHLSPDQRANYLAWLAGGRDSDLTEVGYPFLYFYGLERRVLVDGQDLEPIAREVVRLLNRYTLSGVFTSFLTSFLAYVIARLGLVKLPEAWLRSIFETSSIKLSDDLLALAPAWHVYRGQPLSARWALHIARQQSGAGKSVFDRVPEQFRTLFAKRYKERFADGLKLKCDKRQRAIRYGPPANPSLTTMRRPQLAPPVFVPDPLAVPGQLEPLLKLWSECSEELKPLSRRLAKATVENPRLVYELLPDDLKAETEHPDKPRWDEIVAEYAREDGFALAPVSKLAALHDITQRSRLTLKQSEALAKTAEYVGYLIEPDPRISRRAYAWDELVALFRPESDGPLPTDRYRSAALVLELGWAIAAADGVVTEEETRLVGQLFQGLFVLDEAEVRRLKQLERVFLQRYPSLEGLSRRLRAVLDLEQREKLGRYLAGVAAANGTINEPTLRALRCAYRALSVDSSTLDSFLREHRQAVGEPAAPLNQESIRQILADTEVVGNMLRQVMQEGDETEATGQDPDAVTEPAGMSPVQIRPAPGLPERFQPLLEALLQRPEWSTADFKSLVRRMHLMPEDAVTRINEWAEENLGDMLIEEGEPLRINRNLLQSQT